VSHVAERVVLTNFLCRCPEKKQECVRAAAYMKNLLAKDIKPRLDRFAFRMYSSVLMFSNSDILTRKAFENAITIANIVGGSTNAVLHLLAMARAADVPLNIDDFQRIADRTPFLCDLRPSGRYLMEDLHKVGGIPALLKYLLNHSSLIDGDQMTVTGKTLAENLQNVQELEFTNQDVVRPLENPIKPTGHLTILRGNLAPSTAVAKLTGKEGLRFEVSTRFSVYRS
jgi:dihydroxy-acid dehydratase